MKQLKLILLFLAFIVLTKLSISQQDKIIINHIGLLGDSNHYFLDGGMGHLELIIEKCKVKKNKIILKGKLVGKYSREDIYFYNVYLAENNELDYRLNIKDTLIRSMANQRIKKLSNSFSISTKLKPTEGIYFEITGYGMIEVKIKEKN